MTTPVLYGIKNCDTVKKARNWLDQAGISYRFVDFRSDGISEAQINHWIESIGLEQLLNKRSTTWKNLNASEQAAVQSAATAAKVILLQPTLIKRPLLEAGGTTTTGFKPADYAQLFNH